MTIRRTEKIKLWGIVQGVGFRPFVAKCADKYGMKGEVLNIGGLVDVVVMDTPEKIDFFVERLMEEKPVPAEIVHVRRDELPYREFDAFTILESDDGDDEAAMIPADLSLCPDCLRELYEEDNPRYLHPFISCMVCGPRYTVIDRFPYDRDNTAMIDWPMCDFCEGEYTTRTDRRYHAQTICCHDCGPVLIYRSREEVQTPHPALTRHLPLEGKADADGLAGPTKGGLITVALRASAKKSAAAREKLGLRDIERAAEVLRRGGVIAMKGVGGYNLIADPLSPKAVKSLREIKHREQKPFAVMFKDIETIKAFSAVNPVEAKLLESSAKPIILLEHKKPDEIRESMLRLTEGKNTQTAENNSNIDRSAWFWPERLTGEAFAEIEKSRFVGSFLPSMGAQHLLLDRFGLLIVTSANLSDMPIIKDEDEMFALMDREPLIDGCLYNERDIRVRVDDSVARVIDGQPQMIRRSKGYAPVPLYMMPDDSGRDVKKSPGKNDMLLACGGQLKNSFALSKGAFSYISQYFGDLDSLENQKIYAENVERMAKMFRIKPQMVVCDMHPLYATTAFAESFAAEHGNLPIVRVQHHHAHVASVMAEHQLKGAVIGVSMDGTGYGTDGAIWGGEFLLCEGATFKRMAHLKYVDMIGGDSSMKDAAKTSLCFREAYSEAAGDKNTTGDKWLAGCDDEGVRELAIDLSKILSYAKEHSLPELKNPGEEQLVTAAIKNRINVIKSSSMGRLFDSVSALLGICPYNEYEGQCAILLEDAAARALRAAHGSASEADRLALDFHMQVVSLIYDECCKIREESGAKQVALTGGVFQNKILTEECLKLLREGGFEVYYNVSVSPNDGGIALGQNYIGLYHLLNGK